MALPDEQPSEFPASEQVHSPSDTRSGFGEPNRNVQAHHPGQTSEATKQSGGQGGVRSTTDGRLHDNLSADQRREIGRRGGQAVSRNKDHMAEIGRKGGEAVSRNKEHMANIGRKGGEAVSRDREHMASIGRKGGETVSQDRERMSEIGRKGGRS